MSKNVVICEPTGGLGNQFFCIANAYAYSLRHNKRFYVTKFWKGITKDRPSYWDYLLSYFKDNNHLVYPQQYKKIKSYTEPSLNYEAIPYFDYNVIFKGYFQSEKYFEDYKRQVCKVLSLPDSLRKFAESIVDKYDGKTIVAIHIRRGDYLKNRDYYHILSKQYYSFAKKTMEEKLGYRPIYLYFTNDSTWVKENFKEELEIYTNDRIIEGYKDYEEFAIMQQCHHFIIANSSFSWWASYLSNILEAISLKIVIAPKHWYGPKGPKECNDIYPKDWIKVKDYDDGYFEEDSKENILNLESENWRDNLIIENDMSAKRQNKNEICTVFVNNPEKITVLWDKCISETIQIKDNQCIYDIQKSFINSRIVSLSSENKWDLYVINLENRTDRYEKFITNLPSGIFNVNHFKAIKHKKGAYGCALSHLSLISYAKENNLPYIIVTEDDCLIKVSSEKLIKVLEYLTSNLDKWTVFNGAPFFWDKLNNLSELFVTEELDDFVNINWAQSTSFMIYNYKSYDKLLDFNFNLAIDQYVGKLYLQTIYKHEPFSIQFGSFSDISGSMVQNKEYEDLFSKQYKILKSTTNVNVKSIGIYGIFIGKYRVFYDNFVKNVEEFLYPNIPKNFYIVTDDTNLPLYNDRTFVLRKERIGWPYETLYRFKYFNMFNREDIMKSDFIFFINANGKFVNEINSGLISNDYIFTYHNGYYKTTYKEMTFEKQNKNSTAYIEYNKKTKYEYFGGRFYGARTNKFIEMCSELDNNISIDEKNNYIAVWHDESHLNHFCHKLQLNNIHFGKFDISYHVPEEIKYNFKTINVMYLDKNRIMTDFKPVGVLMTGGNVIQNIA